MRLLYLSFFQLLFWIIQLQCPIQQASSDSSKFRMVDPGEDEKPPHNTRYNFLLRHGSTNTLNSSAASPLMQKKRQKTQMMVFIAITSGPHHQNLRQAIRSTWLLPCIASPHCDYSFFVDCLEDYHQYPHLAEEAMSFSDIVFRNSCALLLSAHPDPRINYGNSPPIPAHLVHRYTRQREIVENSTASNSSVRVKVVKEVVEEPLPDYHLRRRYKIDWKVCFMQHIRRMYEKVDFYVFVEDDSFVCTDNLLHQMSLLHRLSLSQQLSDFRTGTPMYDGYDDSSTIMTSRIAEVFVQHYLEPGLDCPAIFGEGNSSLHHDALWLSWGNSWISKNCNWSAAITSLYHFPINSPNVHCSIGQMQSLEAEVGTQATTVIQLPCITRPLILHHQDAPKVLTKEHSPFQQAHLCDYMLLVDKVKQPDSMHTLWQSATGFHHFHDFSKVFMRNKNAGWRETLEGLWREEEACEQHFPSPNNPAVANDTSLDSGGGHHSGREKRESYPCLFERDTREKEKEKDNRQLRGRSKNRRGERGGGMKKSRRISYRDYFSDEMIRDL